MKLYGYWRSTAAYRVRIALALKGLEFENQPVHLVRDGGEQHKAEYRGKNPQGLVPMLETGEENFVQSLAILRYLESMHPEPAIFAEDPALNAHIEAMAQMIACDIHPLNNLRVLNYLKIYVGVTQEQVTDWYHHWLREGFNAIEPRLQNSETDFCLTSYPSVADICLVAQVYNANRFQFPLTDYPEINRINELCLSIEAFQKAIPENQPDAE